MSRKTIPAWGVVEVKLPPLERQNATGGAEHLLKYDVLITVEGKRLQVFGYELKCDVHSRPELVLRIHPACFRISEQTPEDMQDILECEKADLMKDKRFDERLKELADAERESNS